MPWFRNPFTRSGGVKSGSIEITDDSHDCMDQEQPSPPPHHRPQRRQTRKKLQEWRQYLREQAPKHATLFCQCCDMRIATLLLNFMHLTFSILLELFEWTNAFHVDEPPTLCLLAVIFSGMALWGALQFELVPMCLSTTGLFMLSFLYISEWHVFGLIMIGFILFANGFFIWEMRQGIMTKENYAEAEYVSNEGRQVLEVAHSFADTTKDFVEQLKKPIEETLQQSSQMMIHSGRDEKQHEQEC
jgi:hypothetical protein